MTELSYYPGIDGSHLFINPIALAARGVRGISLVNQCAAGNLIVQDDSGRQYIAPPLTETSWPTRNSLMLTAYIDAPQALGQLEVIVSDEPLTFNTNQLSSLAGSGGSNIQRVTTLPGAPFDGQVVSFVPDQTNFPGVEWLFIFNSATGFWDFVGGSPLSQIDVSGLNRQNTVDNTWQACPGITPVALPHAGDYLFEIGAGEFAVTNTGDIVVVGHFFNGAVYNGGQPQMGVKENTNAGVSHIYPGGSIKTKVNVGAGSTATVGLFSSVHADVDITNPLLNITPVRIQ